MSDVDLAAVERLKEWTGIFVFEGGDRPVMSRPPVPKAASALVREVADMLGVEYHDAIEAADWIASKMERFGAGTAQPVFDMDGNGPICSWCTTIWPLCGHHHLTAFTGEDEDEVDE